MIAVTLVMVIFLIAINLLNRYTAERDAAKTLQIILAGETPEEPGGRNPGMEMPAMRGEKPGEVSGAEMPDFPETNSMAEPPVKPSGEEASENAGEEPPVKPETEAAREALTSEQYFSVRLSEDGKLIEADAAHVASLTEDEMGSLAAEAAADGRERGMVGHYRFLRAEDRTRGETRYIFLDAGQETRAVLRTLLVTLGVGAVTWVLMLLLVIFLSKRAILPIAENIERQKQFVTDAGHEIKTPLAIIQANTDALELHMGANKWTDNIHAQVTRLGSLTQNMLTLARMEEGAVKALPAEAFDAGAALLEALRPFREMAEVRGVAIKEDVPGGAVLVWQRDAYLHLLSLLFENAAKYAREGGFIEVRLRREGKEVVISERNDCAGPLTGDPERLFDRFYRADQARTQKTGGSGIGLSVARAIAEQGGGRVSAAYESDTVIRFDIRLRDMKR